MKALLRRLFRRGPGPPGHRSDDEGVALLEDLSGRISHPEDAPLILQRVRSYSKGGRDSPSLASVYLLLEQYLSEVDQGDYARSGLRRYVVSHYPGLLTEARFRIIFQPVQKQEVLLCRAFLDEVIQRAQAVLGAAGGNVLGNLLAWVRAAPSATAGHPPLPEGVTMPSSDPAWRDLLFDVAEALFAHLAGLMGEEGAGRLYEEAYRHLAQDLVGLETFPVVVEAMPGGLISEEKVQLLSKSQIQRVLLEKVRSLELVNDLLTSKNEELVATQQELIEARREAELANEAKSVFLSRMSHELRTPLNSVLGFTNQLLKNTGGRLNERDLTYLDRVHVNGMHLLELINDLLDLARIEAGRLEVDQAPVEVDLLVREVVDSLEGKVAGTSVALRTRVPPKVATLETDRVKLKRVLINLVGNAIKFTEDGTVTVTLRTEGPHHRPVEIEVADTGIGIPPAELERVFEAFHQVDDGQARRFHGSGLGLAISRMLCELMGYSIVVDSTVGEGTRFTVRFASGAPKHEPRRVDWSRSAVGGRSTS